MKNEKSSNFFAELKSEFKAHQQLLDPKKAPNKAEYAETTCSPPWIRFPVYGFFAILIGFFLSSPLWTEEPDNITNLLLCLAFTICLLAFKTFFTLKVSLFSDYLRFGYYHSSIDVDYKSILSCEVFRDESENYLSLGAIEGRDGSIQYTIPGNEIYAVKITVRDQKKNKRQVYIFTSKRPEVIQKRILDRLPQDPQESPAPQNPPPATTIPEKDN